MGVNETLPKAHQKKSVDERLSAIVHYLIETIGPKRIFLFGSRAKGVSRMGSDIDLAVEGGRELSFREERKLTEALDRLAGIYSVDLVLMERVDHAFRKMIEETGQILYEQD